MLTDGEFRHSVKVDDITNRRPLKFGAIDW